MTTVLSFGGGKDSTCLVAIDLERDRSAELLGITRARLDEVFPSPDRIVFSDTGAEFDETYDNVEKVWQLTGDRFDLVAKDGETLTELTLRLGNVPVMGGGSHVCSKKFKGEVMARWAKQQFPGETITWQIGIEANETRRAVFTPPKGDTAIYTFPLRDLGLDRETLDRLLKDLGWGEIRKSSCTFCPFMSVEEIEELYRNDPEKWELCRRIEHKFEETAPIRYQTWIDAGRPVTKGKKQRAPIGMWRLDSWAEGRRLFIKKIAGKQLTIEEWEQHFDGRDGLIAVQEAA